MDPREPVAGVQNFSTVDARTEETIMDFDESETLDVGDPDFRHWTIRANTYPDEVGSVVFKIDVQTKNIENQAPYLLHGHHLRALTPTPHILEAEAYSGRLGRGRRLQSRAALLRFTNNTTVTSFAVLDAARERVQDLNEGDVVNVAAPQLKTFNIEASLNRNAEKGSVQFYVNGKLFWTENREPYIMVTGNRRWWKEPGSYTVTAIPYSQRNGQGAPGTSLTVSFTIAEIPTEQSLTVVEESVTTNGREQDAVSVYPVPARDVMYILLNEGFPEQDLMVVIRDSQGQLRFKKLTRLTSHPYMLKLTEMGLNNGIYHLQLSRREVTQSITFIKE